MKRRNLIYNIALAGLFCALICIGSYIKIPIPNMPITMQMFFVLTAGLVLPWKTALFSSFAFMVLGLVGLPVFTSGGGIGYVFMPSFGFVIGFVAALTIMGLILNKVKKNTFFVLLAVAFFGTVIIYAIGVPYFALIINLYNGQGRSFAWIIQSALIPFIPKELISIFAAVIVSYKLRPLIAKFK